MQLKHLRLVQAIDEAHAYTKLEMVTCGWQSYRQQRFWTDVCEEKEHAQPPPANRLGSSLDVVHRRCAFPDFS